MHTGGVLSKTFMSCAHCGPPTLEPKFARELQSKTPPNGGSDEYITNSLSKRRAVPPETKISWDDTPPIANAVGARSKRLSLCTLVAGHWC